MPHNRKRFFKFITLTNSTCPICFCIYDTTTRWLKPGKVIINPRWRRFCYGCSIKILFVFYWSNWDMVLAKIHHMSQFVDRDYEKRKKFFLDLSEPCDVWCWLYHSLWWISGCSINLISNRVRITILAVTQKILHRYIG